MEFNRVSFEEIQRRIDNGSMVKMLCIKNQPVFIRPGVVGETIHTYVQVPGQEDLKESTSVVTSADQLVLTQPIGEVLNQYLVHRGWSEVNSKYDKDEDEVQTEMTKEHGARYIPKAAEKVVYVSEENIEFPYPKSWGMEGLFRLMAHGVIVDNGDGGFYGINPVEFHATHSVLETVPAGLQS